MWLDKAPIDNNGSGLTTVTPAQNANICPGLEGTTPADVAAHGVSARMYPDTGVGKVGDD